MLFSQIRKKTSVNLFLALFFISVSSSALAGVSIGGTRIIYPYDAKVTNVKIMNSSDTSSFLIQSWVEDESGSKTKDFIVTPPLYLSGPKNNNSIRVMYAGKELPRDRETLYYFVSKAIPSLDKKEMETKNMMTLTASNRIKLFVRPAGLEMNPEKAPDELSFRKNNGKLDIKNPTPFYITMTDIKMGTATINTVMVSPKSSASVDLPPGNSQEITYSTINDHGATTPVIKKALQN